MSAQIKDGLYTGITSRMPWDEYVHLEGVSITRLKVIDRSPLHYMHRRANPKETQPLMLGRAAHCAVLEPHRFATDHAVWSRRTSSGNMSPRNGSAWDAFRMEHGGKAIITEDEYLDVMAIQAAVRSNPDAMLYLDSGDPEVTMQWALHGRQCKGRADWLTFINGSPVIVGLKTARDCRLFPFSSQAAKLAYHLQWAYYFDGYETITGKQAKVVEIVVESEAPHALVTYHIPEEVILQGRDQYMGLLDKLTKCELTNEWPGPAECEQMFSLPSWVYETQDDLSDIGLEA